MHRSARFVFDRNTECPTPPIASRIISRNLLSRYRASQNTQRFRIRLAPEDTMKMLSALSLASLVTASFVVFGCAGKNNSSSGPDDNSDSTESSASSAQSSRLDQMIFSPVASQDPATAANNLATASNWWPAGCATRTKDATPGVVHITLNECTGPFGLAHWSGNIDVTFSAGAAGALHAQASSRNMTVNGHPVDWSREADITVSGSTKTATGTGSWTRPSTFDPAETVSHVTNFTTIIDSGCRDSSGTATTKVGDREVDATFTDYKVCRNADGSDGCPTGTVVFHHKLSGKTYTVTFDGTNQAKVSGDKGSIEVALVCGG